MKIRRIRVYQVDLPLHEVTYKWSGGKSVTVVDSTVVAVETDDGMVGWGESCPLGPAYLPSYASGVRAGLAELGPQLIGDTKRVLAAHPDVSAVEVRIVMDPPWTPDRMTDAARDQLGIF